MFGLIPLSLNSSSFICECVVLAGWITRDLTSATLASNEKISNLSINSWASFTPPLISKVKIEPAPFGKYSLYNLLYLLSSNAGWLTLSTCGWSFKNSTTFNVFSTCLSTLNDSVSNPCNN